MKVSEQSYNPDENVVPGDTIEIALSQRHLEFAYASRIDLYPLC
jgi:hypothetical protein